MPAEGPRLNPIQTPEVEAQTQRAQGRHTQVKGSGKFNAMCDVAFCEGTSYFEVEARSARQVLKSGSSCRFVPAMNRSDLKESSALGRIADRKV